MKKLNLFIEPPTCLFYYKKKLVDSVNEYTLRNIQLSISKGELKKKDVYFMYENKKYTVIDDNGNLNAVIPNVMDLSYKLATERIFKS
jgi:hypothetical protein